MKTKKNNTKYFINEQELTMEIAVALKELFVAQVESTEKEILMRFVGGQKFVVKVEKA